MLSRSPRVRLGVPDRQMDSRRNLELFSLLVCTPPPDSPMPQALDDRGDHRRELNRDEKPPEIPRTALQLDRTSVEVCALLTALSPVSRRDLASTPKARHLGMVPRAVGFGSEKTSILVLGLFPGLTGSATADHET